MAPSPSPAALPISGHTALAGVLGDPVRHSLSPAMHNAALRELGLDWVYLALPVAAANLDTVLRALEAIDCRGLNVTLPHKRAAAALAAARSPLAERLAAVNTLVRRPEGGWWGANTDVEGFLAPLREGGGAAEGPGRWRGRSAVVLGCGGSARAVLAGLGDLGLGRIRVVGRRADALAALLETCRGWAADLAGIGAGAGEARREALCQADLVVNTTPVGMARGGDPGATDLSPLSEEEVGNLRSDCTVYDLIYTPRPTRLLQLAAARGCRSLDGLEMLVQQGAAALRLWTGCEAVPVATMRAAARAQLGGP
jgi:shikimate dehydrogenase